VQSSGELGMLQMKNKRIEISVFGHFHKPWLIFWLTGLHSLILSSGLMPIPM
jgi:hypothetical protein